jgi:hypothetical protein
VLDRVLRLVTLFALVATPAAAQSASYGLFGAPCSGGRLIPGSGPVPLVPIGLPRFGSVLTIETESSGRSITGISRNVLLLTGISDTSFGGIPLPLDLALVFPNGPVCGGLVTSIEFETRVPSTGDLAVNARVAFPVPRDPSLRGLRFFQQVLVMESARFGPPFLGVSVSAGGVGVIGT